jgi:nucleoside-diphosphate-sugar epimerase
MTGERVVAVTGATGFLGVHVVAALARAGFRVRILSRRELRHEFWDGLALEAVPGSLEDAPALKTLVTGAEAVIHAAGLIKARDRAAFLRTNRDGTLALAQAARLHAPSSRLVAISSLAAREPQLSDYAASKRAGEDALRAAYADAPDQLVILRPPAIYGPWDRETLGFFKAVSGRIAPVFGTGRKAIVHVADAADAIAQLAAGQGRAGLYALSDPNPAGYTMPELMHAAARALGSAPCFVRIPDGWLIAAGSASALWGRWRGQDPIFTAGKAREILHPDWSIAPGELLPAGVYAAKIGITEGFAETVAWYRAANWLS